MRTIKNYENRIIQTVVTSLCLVTGIIIYVLFFTTTDIGIPCIFHLITGMQCPGCGMTHALSSVVQGNFTEAFQYNALSLTICPIIIIYLLMKAFRYIRTGQEEFSLVEILFLIVNFVICVWYFLLRNNLI